MQSKRLEWFTTIKRDRYFRVIRFLPSAPPHVEEEKENPPLISAYRPALWTESFMIRWNKHHHHHLTPTGSIYRTGTSWMQPAGWEGQTSSTAAACRDREENLTDEKRPTLVVVVGEQTKKIKPRIRVSFRFSGCVSFSWLWKIFAHYMEGDDESEKLTDWKGVGKEKGKACEKICVRGKRCVATHWILHSNFSQTIAQFSR